MRILLLAVTVGLSLAARAAAQEGTYRVNVVYQEPALTNLEEVRRAIDRESAAGHGGTVLLEFLVSRRGQRAGPRITRSSGDAVLDSAALRVGAVMRFRPAHANGQPVAARIEIPVIFPPSRDP